MKKYTLLSDFLKINQETLTKNNILDNFVDNDSGFYICLKDIETSNMQEFINYKEKFKNAIEFIYSEPIKTLKSTLFAEPSIIFLGDVIYGHKGKGMQLEAIKAIKHEIKKNKDYYLDTSKFIELAHVSKKIGRDSLNDFLSNLYKEELLLFTERKCLEMSIVDLNSYTHNNKTYKIKTFNDNGTIYPIIFFPLNIMRKYVYVLTYNDLFNIGYSYEKLERKINKETYLKTVSHKLLSKKIKSKEFDLTAINEYKNLKGSLKYNNLDIYNEIKDDLFTLTINGIKDNIEDISNYVVSTFNLIITKIISIDARKKRQDKIIATDNYKQASAYACSRINTLLQKNNYKTKIIITRGSLFVIKEKEYIQISIRTAYNFSCTNELYPNKKTREIKNSICKDYKIIICDPNNKFINYINKVPAEKRSKFYVLKPN